MNGLVLVTGATGFIGSHLVTQLVERRLPVRVLARRPEALPPAVRGRVDVRSHDLRDREGWRRTLAEVETVLHLAACARAWTSDPREFVSANLEAVGALLHAARERGLSRLVHVSTILTLPPAKPAPGERRLTPYEATKLAGERLVDAYATEGRHAVVVHPARVYGPGPLTDANVVTRVIALYLAGRFRMRIADGDVRGSYAHVDDVAAGIRLAAERGQPGAHYLLGGENASLREFLALVRELTGVCRSVLTVPPWAAIAAARAAEWWGRAWGGGGAPIIRDWIRVLLEDRPGDIAPARRDLGYDPRPLRAGLEETIAWLRDRGRVAA
ncbi:MAG TPA: NAD-dependent epimerase/dehydratase family protein [Gemmatimonadales bacterium]|nr:NAD-dependent epimerase/dehydratase family protein [Gemmatimonadales bacterium]